MPTVVTSFSRKYYDLYGKQFVETFVEHWPAEVTLLCYIEESSFVHYKHAPNIQYKNLFCESLPFRGFFRRFSDNPYATGRKQTPWHGEYWDSVAKAAGYNYLFDAVRFCRKPFSMQHAASTTQGKLLWLDADITTHQAVPIEIFDELIPDFCSVSYLKRKRIYSECGAIGYNLVEPDSKLLIDSVANTYASTKFLGHLQWHDSWIFDVCVRQTINKKNVHYMAHEDTLDIFAKSELGKYCTHHKGVEKFNDE